MSISKRRVGASLGLFLGVILGVALPLSMHSYADDQEVFAAPTIITEKSTDQYISTYYNSISTSQTGLPLAASLETLLQGERSGSFSYGSLQSTAFPYTDVDPTRPNGGYIVSFYSGTPVSGYTGMNKEHTWPNSHGGGNIENDPHMVRPTLSSENSARGNSYFADSSAQGWDPNTFGNDKYRGIAARIIFYGASIGYTEGLRLEDVGFVSGSGNGGRMGKLSDLLTWNLQYPIDATEIIRNETLDRSLNYNRNPFIDHPEYACKIWGGTNSTTQAICASSETEPTSISVSPSSASIGINGTQSLTVAALPSSASTSVAWSTSNDDVATVANGIVTGVAEGTATIKATSTLNFSVYGTCAITITPPVPPTSLAMSSFTLSVSVEQTSPLSVTASPSGANNSVSWSTSNDDVSIVSNGVVSGLSEGTATITATSTVNSSVKTTCAVTIVAGTSGLTSVSNYSDIVAGDYIITATFNNVNYYLPANASGFAAGSSQAVSFTSASSIDIGNAWKFTSTGTANQWKISCGSYYLNSSATNNGISATTAGSADSWTASAGSTSIYLYSQSGGRHLTTYTAGNQWRGYSTANTNGNSNIVLYKLGSGTVSDPTEDAATWSTNFLSQTSSGCSAKNPTALASVWNGLATSYDALGDAAKMVVYTADPNAAGSDIENAVARYIDIVQKYELEAFIGGIVINSPTIAPNAQVDVANAAIAFAILSLGASALVIIFIVAPKSKKR